MSALSAAVPNYTKTGTSQKAKSIPSHVRITIWQNKLPQHSLPIDTHTAKQALRLLNDDNCDSSKLAKVIEKDPILCLRLFHCAEDALKQRDGDIQHLTHLLSLIGLNQLENIIRTSPRSQDKEQGLQEVLAASLFAAQLSRVILPKKYGSTNDRLFLPSLFFNAPLWLMWIAAPKTMAQGQQLASKGQQTYMHVSTKKLGFYLPNLLKKSHTFIHLPNVTHKALTINPLDNIPFWAKVHHLNQRQLKHWLSEDKDAKQYLYNPETGIYLINQYVMSVYFDWNGKHTRRYTTLLCQYLGIEEAQFNTHVVDAAMNMNLPRYCQGMLTPINRLHGLHREDAVEGKPTTPLEAWLKKIHQSQNIDSALECALNALTKGIGVNHCIIMRVDEKEIHTQSHYGFTQDSPISHYHQAIDHKQDLFNQLIKKPACIAIQPADFPKAAKRLPKQFSTHCDLQPCGLLSVFQHNQPKALIYCDQQQWDQQTHHDFKVIGKHLSQTLTQL